MLLANGHPIQLRMMLNNQLVSTEGNQNDRWPLALLISLFTAVLIRNAWLADDAYITFRTVDNFIHGYGLTWNPSERVQVYTHPLWMLVLSSFSLFTHEVYYTSIFVSILVSLAAVVLLAFKVARDRFAAYLAISILLLSKAYIDYSVSGLENPLTHLIIVLFLLVFIRIQPGYKKIFLLSIITSMTAINRMDTILLFIPPIIYEAVLSTRQHRLNKLQLFYALSTGSTPFFLWLLFSIFYYGFAFPNTAYAKLNTGISPNELYEQGLYYYLNSLNLDPLTLIIIMVGILFPFYSKQWRDVTIAVGIMLYLLYIIRIGGDFMSGRFFTGPLIGAVILLSNNQIASIKSLLPALLVVLVIGFSAPYPPLISDARYGSENREILIDNKGVADERAYYYPSTGLLRANRNSVLPDSLWAQEGREARKNGLSVVVRSNIGFFGFFAGPEVHIVDRYGLADPLLARLPAARDENWRIGHFTRRVPAGYVETLESGRNRIADKNLAIFYEKLALITRGKLLNWKRLAEIWRINTGTYAYLIDYPTYRYGERIVSLVELSESKSAGTPWDQPGNFMFSREGIQIKLGRVRHAKYYEISLDSNDDYEVLYLRGNTEVGIQEILAKRSGSGLAIYHKTVPDVVAEQGFDRIVVYPLIGDDRYSIGHLLLLEKVAY